MPEADTSSTGSDAAVDTSNTGDESGSSDDSETGSVTQEEIAAALGPKYKTVAPVAEEKTDENTDEKDDSSETTDETTETETDAQSETTTEDQAAADTKTVADTATGPDFSFTVEDANGQSFKIGPDDNIEKVLNEFEPKSNGQIIAILDQLREAKVSKAEHDKDQTEQADLQAREERVTNIQKGWDAEFKQLNITNDDRRSAIYQYMAAENDKRAQAGRPLIASVEDAKLGLEAREAGEAKQAADKAEKETARKNGALVGGSSAAASSSTPVYRGGAKNATQALKSMNLI